MNRVVAAALAASLALGGGAANAQNYGLGGNYNFKPAPSLPSAPPPALSMPRNSLGAVAPPPSIPMQNLRPVSPPSPPPVVYTPPPQPRTSTYVGPSTSNSVNEAQVGVQRQINPTTQLRTGVDVAPNLPPSTTPPTINGGGVTLEKKFP